MLLCLFIVCGNCLNADELAFSFGGGSQPGSDQHNKQLALDYFFYKNERSSRTSLSLGLGYTYIQTDAGFNKRLNVLSLNPRLTLTPVSNGQYYFFVQALGPSYISGNALGDRKQDRHFAFQARIGVGIRQQLDKNKMLLLQMSWKHLSNANLFSDNDGIDIPFVFSLGIYY